MLSNLVKRDIQIHYRRSALGILWSQANPLFSLLVFSFVFQKLVPLNIPNYQAYVFTGLLIWNWFSACINLSSYTLIQSRDLVRKPQFASEMIIVVSVAANLINLLLSLPVLVGLLLLSGIVPNWTVIFLPLVALIQFLFTLGLAWLFSSLNVFFRDMQHVVSLAVTVWFYLTPVFYQLSAPNEYQLAITLNPMAQLIGAYRQILLNGQPPDFAALFWVTLVALAVFGLGLSVFRRLKYSFVDEL